MIEAGLPKFSQQLEEISGAATKEYALQKNLAKMKEEWVDIKFECVPYRYLVFFYHSFKYTCFVYFCTFRYIFFLFLYYTSFYCCYLYNNSYTYWIF